MKKRKPISIWASSAIVLGLMCVNVAAETVVMQKQNTMFSIDGNNGAKQGQQIYLYKTNEENVNQQWVETNLGGAYYSYQKQNTKLCLDGGSGARKRQAVTLETCNDRNENQHWEKVSISNGSFRLEKRGTGFSIDGNNGGENRQLAYLWESDNGNVNQQWQFLGQSVTPRLSFEVLGNNNSFEEGERVRVSVNADDPNGHIRSVSLSIDNNFVRTENRAPYGWGARDPALQNLSPGTYRLSAVAQDNDGLTTQVSTSITIKGASVGRNKPNATVFTLADLREAITRSDHTIVMEGGDYNLTDLPENSRNLLFSGSNNTIDLVGVYIEVPVGSTNDRESYLTMDGSNNTLLGGTFEDTYINGLTRITNFVDYNENRTNLASGLRGEAAMSIYGEGNTIDGIKMTVRGSFPYGYGSLFGINQVNSFGLSKRCGIVIKAPNNTITNAEIQMRSFCHGIYMQEDADNTLISNTLVEGRVRETNEMLAEGRGSLPDQNNYRDVEGNDIRANEVNSLAEDGIRSYSGTGSVRVENSTVKNMRGGFRLYLGGEATVINAIGIDNGTTNYNLPNNARVINSSANFTYAPINDHRLGRSWQDIEMTILPSPNAIGAHNIADILGNDHNIVFHRAPGPEDTQEQRAIVVSGNNSTIRNETEYRIVLEFGTRGNTVISAGEVIDNGSNNVSRIDLDL